MKYVVLLGDGMADDPQAEAGGRTPLELARTPHLDRIAAAGRIGLTQTIPPGMEPGSDVANLAVLGFAPEKYYTGRATIEAAAQGIKPVPGEAAFRCNLVTLAGDPADPILADYSGGHPSPEEQEALLETLNRGLATSRLRFVPGVSFRNLCLIKDYDGRPVLKPPHDFAGRRVKEIWPEGPGAELLARLQEESRRLFLNHPVNQAREKKGKSPVNSIWLWGMGRPASFPSFQERHGKRGAVITGVDLVRGLGRLLDMEIVPVPGATGYVDTDFEGKALAAVAALTRMDFVFLHVEAPDEAGHEGNLELKIQAIENFDRRTVALVLDGLNRFEDYRVLLLPDHETPVKLRSHRGGAVPFACASRKDLEKTGKPGPGFSEKSARAVSSSPVPAPLLLESHLFSW